MPMLLLVLPVDCRGRTAGTRLQMRGIVFRM